ncbi:MAG: hypothetical protein P1U56_10480 [Saprospiraceae bacterium]|nr:hypothetical protein [Saprospiraceae bacterium]
MTDIKKIKPLNPLKGVMLNAYPDSIGQNLNDIIQVLSLPDFKETFSLFYILPTFFNSDLDRGFSIIDYDLNKDLVSQTDIDALDQLGIQLKFDIVLNHLSVASPQFKDLIEKGEDSIYRDFFIDWNKFWEGNGSLNEEGIRIPDAEHLDKLFMRKSGLPVLKIHFPDGTTRFYWNTFYQKITQKAPSPEVILELTDLSVEQANELATKIADYMSTGKPLEEMAWNSDINTRTAILQWIHRNPSYLGQMDVNAKSSLVWSFYKEVLQKVKSYGCQILRLDAFAYLHKEVGRSNFFNVPGTWDYLARINEMAQQNELVLLPEIHAEYGLHLHDQVAKKGYIIYDFFLPGLLIHAIEKRTNEALLRWAREIVTQDFKTVNMLGCHDGIPMLDLKGKEVDGNYIEGLLSDEEIEEMMQLILARGGRVKNLYGADGKKISYYQINATYYSALGENDQKLLIARAIQLFMPGTPQIWYLDLFAGVNDYEAAENAGSGGHKEINRTTLSIQDITNRLKQDVVQKQLKMIHLRNTSNAFQGRPEFLDSAIDQVHIRWENGQEVASLLVDLDQLTFTIEIFDSGTTYLLH